MRTRSSTTKHIAQMTALNRLVTIRAGIATVRPIRRSLPPQPSNLRGHSRTTRKGPDCVSIYRNDSSRGKPVIPYLDRPNKIQLSRSLSDENTRRSWTMLGLTLLGTSSFRFGVRNLRIDSLRFQRFDFSLQFGDAVLQSIDQGLNLTLRKSGVNMLLTVHVPRLDFEQNRPFDPAWI